MDLPQHTRDYQCHHIDSSRWQHYRKRSDDIIVVTSLKAGTTWTQGILANMLFPDGKMPATPSQMSPWLDNNLLPIEKIIAKLESQRHRRFIKTHLPLEGISYHPDLKYIYVSRDGRDVFMSLWNHYGNYTDEMYDILNSNPGYEHEPFPRCPEDIHKFWASWISRSYFDWEGSGWPFWSHLENVQSWWNYRHLPNIEFFHYSDMLSDLEGEMRRIAAYLEIDVPQELWPRVVNACTFEGMKKKATEYAPNGGVAWKGGADTFINKGTNGRWKDILTNEELDQYQAACDKVLTPECRAWLEFGRASND